MRGFRLQCVIMALGIMLALNLTNSGLSSSEHKYMLDMSAVQHFALGVEMILLSRILNDSMPAVCVVTLPKYSSQSPPAVILVRYGSSFLGLYATVYLGYTAVLPGGRSFLGIHSITSIPCSSWYPWHSLPNSFSPDLVHLSRVTGL